jgi:hypothetical protein
VALHPSIARTHTHAHAAVLMRCGVRLVGVGHS